MGSLGTFSDFNDLVTPIISSFTWIAYNSPRSINDFIVLTV